MTIIHPADYYKELEIHYYEEGLFIKSTINIESIENNKRNYEIPIIVVANNTFGLKVIHGLGFYSIYKADISNYLFNRSLLMKTNSNNWWVFIPSHDYTSAEKLKNDLGTMHKEKLSIYFEHNYKQPIDFNNRIISLGFGLGVE